MKTKKLTTAALLLAFAAVFVTPRTLFTVDEREQVIITQFGEYQRTIKEPGMHVMLPVIQTVHRFERRILATDTPEAEYLTLDKKRLVADPVTRWKITDPFLFFKTVRDERGARARLDDLVLSELRREMGSHNFADVIAIKREAIMDTVAARAREKAREFGIEVVDVRIKRADLPKEVQSSVFARMVAERERIAKQYRAEGEEEAAKLRAQTDKERTIIMAEAQKQSQVLRGEGDAAASAIYAEAYGRDPEFYAFVRSLEAYEQFLGKRSTLLLSADSGLLRYMTGPRSSASGSGEGGPALGD